MPKLSRSPNVTFSNSWALWGHQTLRFPIVGRLPWGHRCNTWRIGMPKLSRPPNVTFYNSWALWVHQTVRFTIGGHPQTANRTASNQNPDLVGGRVARITPARGANLQILKICILAPASPVNPFHHRPLSTPFFLSIQNCEPRQGVVGPDGSTPPPPPSPPLPRPPLPPPPGMV